jgi:hypothetical protein
VLVSWVGATVMLGGVLTIDMPWWPRLFVMMPALCLLAAVAVESVLAWAAITWTEDIGPALGRWGTWRASAVTAVGALAVASVIAYCAAVSIQHYFHDYPNTVMTDAYRTRFTDIARYVAQLPAGTHVVLYSSDDLSWSYPTIQFMSRQVVGSGVTSESTLLTAVARRGHAPLLLIVAQEQTDAFLRLLRTPGALPPGQLSAPTNPGGVTTFIVYAMPAAVAATPLRSG